MNLRKVINHLLNLPVVHEDQDILESRERQKEIEQQETDIARRLEALGYEVDLIRRRRTDHDH